MNKPVCITFAAPVGASKSPISNYLSWNLGLPVFSKDPIRSEFHEDLLAVDIEDENFQKTWSERLEACFAKKRSFIFDVSVDRTWAKIKEQIEKDGYEKFVISITLTKDLLVKMYEAKGYLESLKRVDQLIDDHNKFLAQFEGDVNLTITDENFKDRLNIASNAVDEFLKRN